MIFPVFRHKRYYSTKGPLVTISFLLLGLACFGLIGVAFYYIYFSPTPQTIRFVTEPISFAFLQVQSKRFIAPSWPVQISGGYGVVKGSYALLAELDEFYTKDIKNIQLYKNGQIVSHNLGENENNDFVIKAKQSLPRIYLKAYSNIDKQTILSNLSKPLWSKGDWEKPKFQDGRPETLRFLLKDDVVFQFTFIDHEITPSDMNLGGTTSRIFDFSVFPDSDPYFSNMPKTIEIYASNIFGLINDSKRPLLGDKYDLLLSPASINVKLTDGGELRSAFGNMSGLFDFQASDLRNNILLRLNYTPPPRDFIYFAICLLPGNAPLGTQFEISGRTENIGINGKNGSLSMGQANFQFNETSEILLSGDFDISLTFRLFDKPKLIISGAAKSAKINAEELVKTRWGRLTEGVRGGIVGSLIGFAAGLLLTFFQRRIRQ